MRRNRGWAPMAARKVTWGPDIALGFPLARACYLPVRIVFFCALLGNPQSDSG